MRWTRFRWPRNCPRISNWATWSTAPTSAPTARPRAPGSTASRRRRSCTSINVLGGAGVLVGCIQRAGRSISAPPSRSNRTPLPPPYTSIGTPNRKAPPISLRRVVAYTEGINFAQEGPLMSQPDDGIIPLADNPTPPPPVQPRPATAAEALANVRVAAHPPAAGTAVPGGVPGGDLQAVEQLNRAYKQMAEQLGKVIVGQTEVIEQVLTAMFCQGHILLVGVPGLAKTLLVKTISECCSCQFKRVQFTPDLMPSDITGTDVLEEDRTTGKRAFRFVQGAAVCEHGAGG